MKNICEECNVCCCHLNISKDLMPWRDTDKEKNEVCDKLVNEKCSIYPQRPDVCVKYKCFWYMIVEQTGWFPIEWRPDNLGVLATAVTDKGVTKFIIKETRPNTMVFENLKPVVDAFLKKVLEVKSKQKGKTLTVFTLYGEEKVKELVFVPNEK